LGVPTRGTRGCVDTDGGDFVAVRMGKCTSSATRNAVSQPERAGPGYPNYTVLRTRHRHDAQPDSGQFITLHLRVQVVPMSSPARTELTARLTLTCRVDNMKMKKETLLWDCSNSHFLGSIIHSTTTAMNDKYIQKDLNAIRTRNRTAPSHADMVPRPHRNSTIS
jgi:hypothetical protein